MKIFVIVALSVVVMIGMMVPNIYADVTRTQNFDGIDGWTCYADDQQCNGPNKYPANIEQSTAYGKSIPSLHVGGDPITGGAICAEKIIVSDWNIEQIDISLDVIGAYLERVQPLVRIGELYGFYPSDENYKWKHYEHTQQIHVSEQNSISIKLCVIDGNRATVDRNVYYDNVIIKTYEVDPEWESEQAAAQEAAEHDLAESEKAAQAAATAAAEAAATAAAEAAATAAAEAAATAAATAAAEAAATAAAAQAAANSAADAAASNAAANQLEKINELNQLGLNFLNQGHLDDSLSVFDQVLQEDPVNILALTYKGMIFHQKGMNSDAITTFKEILIFKPGHLSALYNIGYIELQSENYPESLTYFKQVSNIDSNFHDTKAYILYVENLIKEKKAVAQTAADKAAQAAADKAAQAAADKTAQAAADKTAQAAADKAAQAAADKTAQAAADKTAQAADAAAEAAANAATAQAAANAAAANAAAANAAAANAAANAAAEAAANTAAEAAANAAAANAAATDYVEISSEIPIEITPDNSKIFDTSSNSLDVDILNNSYIFTKSWKNDQLFTSQSFAYILKITDSEGFVISLSHISGTLGPRQTFEQSLSFQPLSYGTYTITAYVWDDVENPTALTHPESVLIQLDPQKSLNQNISNNWLEEFMP